MTVVFCLLVEHTTPNTTPVLYEEYTQLYFGSTWLVIFYTPIYTLHMQLMLTICPTFFYFIF